MVYVPGSAELAERSRLGSRLLSRTVHIEWYAHRVVERVNATMLKRIQTSMELLKSKLISNISKPVGITYGPRGGIIKIRSKTGEYPRSDTGRLMRSIHYRTKRTAAGPIGTIWSNANYATYLEYNLNRKLFRATYLEVLPIIRLIMGKYGLEAISWNESTV